MNLFKRKRASRNERIVLATTGEVVELAPNPMTEREVRRPAAPEPATATPLKDLSDLELFGAFVVSRGNGDLGTMATVQREIENRGLAAELADL